jgi:hypothetical protein
VISTERELLTEFLEHFKRMFDEDWGYTKEMLQDIRLVRDMIGDDGTFLDPHVEDESDNWASRGALLQSCRELVAYLKENELIAPDF